MVMIVCEYLKASGQSCTRSQIKAALVKHHWDVVDAIMELWP